jgi:hypothetical protein
MVGGTYLAEFLVKISCRCVCLHTRRNIVLVHEFIPFHNRLHQVVIIFIDQAHLTRLVGRESATGGLQTTSDDRVLLVGVL